MQYILAEALSSHCDNCPPCLSGRPPPPRRRRAAPFVTPRPRAPGSAPAQRLPAPRRRGGGAAPRGGDGSGRGFGGNRPGTGSRVVTGAGGSVWGGAGGGGGLVTCRSCAGEGPAGKPSRGSGPGSPRPARPRRRRGSAPRSGAAEPRFGGTRAVPARPWPLPSLHSAAVPPSPLALPPPGSRSSLPLSQAEANGMRGQDFGIHHCLRETGAGSPRVSCQSCQQPSSPVFIRRSSLLPATCPAGRQPGSPAAPAGPPPPRPPVPACPAGTAPRRTLPK